MDTLSTAISMMKPLCFKASVDLKNAYYTVSIASSDQKYLKFIWEGQLYKFVCFPNGLACCPRMFTKLLKPVYATLRQQGYESSGYIDDSYLQGDNFADCIPASTRTFWQRCQNVWFTLRERCQFTCAQRYFVDSRERCHNVVANVGRNVPTTLMQRKFNWFK